MDRRPRYSKLMNVLIYGYKPISLDHHLLYKVWLVNLALNIPLAITLIAQYIWHFDIKLIFFKINYLEDKPYMVIQFFYPCFIFPVLLLLSLSYAVLLFSARSTAFRRESSEFVTAVGLAEAKRRGPDKPIQLFLAALVITVAMIGMPALPLFISSYRYMLSFIPDFNQPSPGKVVFLLLFYVTSYQMLICTAVYTYIYTLHLFVKKYIFR